METWIILVNNDSEVYESKGRIEADEGISEEGLNYVVNGDRSLKRYYVVISCRMSGLKEIENLPDVDRVSVENVLSKLYGFQKKVSRAKERKEGLPIPESERPHVSLDGLDTDRDIMARIFRILNSVGKEDKAEEWVSRASACDNMDSVLDIAKKYVVIVDEEATR